MRLLKLAIAITLLQAGFLLPILYWGPSLATTIVRSTKAGSTTSFATSNSLGNILAVADLDTDLNNAYTAINGGIDSTNITDGSIAAVDLGIGSVTSTKILDATIISTDLAINATLNAGPVAGAASISLNIINVEADVIPNTTITTRGGNVVILGFVPAAFNQSGGGGGALTFRLYRDASVIKTWATQALANSSGTTIPMPLSLAHVDTPSAGAHTYKLTAQTGAASQTFETTNTVGAAGGLFLMELS